MIDILMDTLIDTVKLIPFLFITFYLMEYIEHKFSNKTKKQIENSGKYGPMLGSFLGAFPQCGFSVAATNLYATRVITLGTLISIYLATSDEMLPIMISQNVDIKFIILVISLKVVIGMIYGLIIDRILRKKETIKIKNICEKEHCHCDESIFLSTLKHTINIILFIFIIELFLNIIVEYFGNDFLKQIFMKNSIFGSFLTSVVGLIPNCGASVIITELYLSKVITFGSLIAGLLTGSGVGILILFKTNKDIKENFKILGLLYGLGVISGIIIDIILILV